MSNQFKASLWEGHVVIWSEITQFPFPKVFIKALLAINKLTTGILFNKNSCEMMFDRIWGGGKLVIAFLAL